MLWAKDAQLTLRVILSSELILDPTMASQDWDQSDIHYLTSSSSL
jgi:hypothetical protein